MEESGNVYMGRAYIGGAPSSYSQSSTKIAEVDACGVDAG